MNVERRRFYVKNMMSGLVTVVIARNKYNAIQKGINWFGINQVRLCNR
jgi:hypothetical protein